VPIFFYLTLTGRGWQINSSKKPGYLGKLTPSLKGFKFRAQDFQCFRKIWIFCNAVNRTHNGTLRLIIMTDTFSATGRVDFVNFRAEDNGFIRALRHTNVAVNTIPSNKKRHASPGQVWSAPPYLTGKRKKKRGLIRHQANLVFQPSFNRRENKFGYIATQNSNFTNNGTGNKLVLV